MATLYNLGMVARERLPGADLVAEGLADLSRGRRTMAALLVSIGAPRLRSLGIEVPVSDGRPEHELYALLSTSDASSAHARYNALLRRLVSFERALARLHSAEHPAQDRQ